MEALDYLAWAILAFVYFFIFIPVLFAAPSVSYWDIVKGSIFLHIVAVGISALVLACFWAVVRLLA